ncbi:MAG: cytochrome oxidase putative small subunit CydP [Chromatiales bacterium]
MARKNGHRKPEAPRHPTGFAIEIVAVLVVKTVALALIWWASFSEPIAPSMQLEPDAVTRQLLAYSSVADER